MATLREVSGKLESVRDGQTVQSKVLIDGQENQTKVQTSNSEALKGVMENVVMRVGRSENLLSQMFGHLGYIRRNLSKGGSNTSGDDLESRNETKIWQSSMLEAIQNLGASKEEDDPKKDDKPSEMLTSNGKWIAIKSDVGFNKKSWEGVTPKIFKGEVKTIENWWDLYKVNGEEIENDFDLTEVRKLLSETPGVIVQDDVGNNVYPMPITAHHKDEVFVGRIRRDESQENSLNLWIVSDNLRKGAATNTIQIAEYLVEKNLV